MRSQRLFKKPDGEKAKKHFKLGKQKAQLEDHAAAIREFDACLSHQSNHHYAMFEKGQSHLALNQLAEAIVAFEVVAANSDTLREKANSQIAHICHISQRLTQRERDFIYSHPSQVLRKEVISANYAEQFAAITQLHGQIASLPFKEQVSAIIRMIDLCHHYYTKRDGEYRYINADLLGDSRLCQATRLHLLGNVVAKGSIMRKVNDNSPAMKARRFADVLEEDGLQVLKKIKDDLHLNDALEILRMIFQSIHQLPRDQRGVLVPRMPWGKNSWYHLDFCTTFFRNGEQQNEISLAVDDGFTAAAKTSLFQFQLSLRYELVLVKSVIPDIIEQDLPFIRSFFAKVHDGLSPNDGIKMQDLPNLRMLLWHFKHIYQLLKLSAVLPMRYAEDSARVILKEADMQMGITKERPLVFKPLQQLLLTEYDQSFTQHLKKKFSILRRMQIVGEVFSKRNWGSQLDELAFMDPDLFTTIRNGFSHPDELTTPAVIEAIERDNHALADICEELTRFRMVIYRHIIERQASFPHLANLNELDQNDWAPIVLSYWQAIKNMYRIPHALNGNDYCPHEPLISADEMAQMRELLTGCRSRDKILDMLSGNIPFCIDKSEFDPEQDKYPINREQGVRLEGEAKRINNDNKKALKVIDSLLTKAHKDYSGRKKAYLQRTKAEGIRLAGELKGVRTAAMTPFPMIRKLAAEIFATYSDESAKRPAMNRESVLMFLQQRVILLRQLIMEIPYYQSGETGDGELKSQICNDIDLLYALTYLVAQIMALLNKLNSEQVLAFICPAVFARMEYYMQIRNALEHNDPVIDSIDHSYIQMASKSHMHLCEIALELGVRYFGALTSISPDALANIPESDKTSAHSTKQRKAMTLSSAGNHDLFFTVDTAKPLSDELNNSNILKRDPGL